MYTELTSFHLAYVVGLLLGDASFATNNNMQTARIIFAQTWINSITFGLYEIFLTRFVMIYLLLISIN